MKIKVEEKILWTDSLVVLNWLKTTKPLSVFVKNRVAQITNDGDISFRYISSHENLADIASRGLEVNNLQNSSLWWHGPEWLCFEKDRWPTWGLPDINSQILQGIQSEYRTGIVFPTTILVGKGPTGMEFLPPLEIDINQLSTLCRLVCVTGEQQRSPLTANEMDIAKTQWLKQVQSKHFSATNEKTRNLMRQLNVRIDETGLMRCYGRICNAELPTSTVNPILLPQDDYFTELIIRDIHTDTLHAGTSQTLSSIRQSYWIPQGRITVRKILKRCVICMKIEGGPYKTARFPDFPAERVRKAKPFSYSGVDYFGPLYVRDHDDIVKVWISLFTCMSVRAVHMEVARDMTAEQFLHCFRRFTSRRGTPQMMYSDNAPHFKLVNKTLEQAIHEVLASESVQTYAANHNIVWRFAVD